MDFIISLHTHSDSASRLANGWSLIIMELFNPMGVLQGERYHFSLKGWTQPSGEIRGPLFILMNQGKATYCRLDAFHHQLHSSKYSRISLLLMSDLHFYFCRGDPYDFMLLLAIIYS